MGANTRAPALLLRIHCPRRTLVEDSLRDFRLSGNEQIGDQFAIIKEEISSTSSSSTASSRGTSR